MYGSPNVSPSARIVNYNHIGDRRNRAAITKLLEAITNIDSNVLELANAMVNTASPAVRGRLMDLVVALIFAEADAYVCQNDESDGPRNAMELVETLNRCGIIPKP